MTIRRSFYAFLLLPALAGCGKHTATAPSGNTLRYAIGSRPTTFDPAMVQDSATIDLLQNMFDGLVRWTPQNTIAPALASSWDISKDGRTYTFHLRPGVKFQDGRALTAKDVVFSLTRALDPGLASPVALDYLGNIVGAKALRDGKASSLAGVTAIDDSTVQIKTTKPGVYWLGSLTYPTGFVVSLAEASAHKPMTDAELAKGAGTGPFELASYNPDQGVKLTANAGYFDGAPKISGIERPIVTNANTEHAMYQQGTLDIAGVQRGDLEADLKDPALKNDVHFFPRAATFYLALNQKAFPAFRDVRVRQAIAYAIDKAEIRTIVLGKRMDIAQDMLPAGIPGFDPAYRGLPFDPAKAKLLLAAAGYEGGKGFPTIPITYREGNPDIEKTVDLIRTMLDQNLGIKVELRRMEWGVMLSQRNKDALPAWHSNWAADYLDPQDFYSTLFRTGSSSNHVGYSNPQFDRLCDAADIEQAPEKRTQLYRQAGHLLGEDVPMIPLYYLKRSELVKPYVHNLDDCLLGHLPMRNVTLK